MECVSLDSVSKKRHGRKVLDNVSFKAHRGEITVLYGPSGSGKSTILRCINRLIEPDSGSITLGGRDIKSYDPIDLRRRVGMVFQRPAVFPGTVASNISYGLRLQDRSDKGAVLGALRDSGLDRSFLGRNASRLSGGEQQRLCLARALTLDPDILLLDEPTSSLDDKAATRVEGTMRRLIERRELTVIWVTHDMAQVKRLANRVIDIRKGRVIAS